jgi:signal transduction histidine kinase
MTEATETMEALVADLLSLARQGETVDDAEPVWLPTVAREAWTDVQTGDAAELVVDVNRSVPGDEHRLRELLQNLYANAVRHGGADVTVRVVALPDEAGFAVEDDGRGFGDADQSSLFDHGYTTDDDGTGFGLAIVKRVVDAHGWSIRATESETGGARFEILTG